MSQFMLEVCPCNMDKST